MEQHIFMHLSGFDGIFILKHLLSYGQVNPLIFNGRLISIKVKVLGNKNQKLKLLYLKILIYHYHYL